VQVTSSPPRSNRLGVLSLLGFFGQTIFVVAVALLPFFHPGYSSVNDPISFLLLGPYGLVLTGALLAAGLGSLALAVGIRRTTRGVRGSLLGSVSIGLWAVGLALAGVIPTDAEGRPTQGATFFHGAVGTLAFVFGLAGVLLLSGVFAREARWASFYPLSLALGFAAFVGLTELMTVQVGLVSLIEAVSPLSRSFYGLGIVQRVFVGTVILWMILAAARLRSIAKSERFTPPSG